MHVRMVAAALAMFAAAACGRNHPQTQLAALEAELAAQDSATAALARWCVARGIGDGQVNAIPVGGPDQRPPPQVRQWLGVSAETPLAYRHIRLNCGGVTLSEAHNWYVPGHLPDKVNQMLQTTQTPFGRAVATLGFNRERLDARRSAPVQCPKGTVLVHWARLRLASGLPLALVLECYTAASLSQERR